MLFVFIGGQNMNKEFISAKEYAAKYILGLYSYGVQTDGLREPISLALPGLCQIKHPDPKIEDIRTGNG